MNDLCEDDAAAAVAAEFIPLAAAASAEFPPLNPISASNPLLKPRIPCCPK